MKKASIFIFLFASIILIGMVTYPAAAGKKKPSIAEMKKWKVPMDDPRPYIQNGFYKHFLSDEQYMAFVYDVPSMKQAWSEIVGFKAPEVVGKIAPEIKPGKYSYKDKQIFPGLKELMPEYFYEMFDKPGPPVAGKFSEIIIIPTRQYYYSLPVAMATKKHDGQTKLDDAGYIIDSSYSAGYPFPRPSGNFKAQQILYNMLKRYLPWENSFSISVLNGYDKNLRRDMVDACSDALEIRLSGRVQMAPIGWFDKRAADQGEETASIYFFQAPRDQYGNISNIITYISPEKLDSSLMYLASLRRVRKMTSTDTQDAFGGTDADQDSGHIGGFAQKMSPNIYPMDYKVLEEREYLVPAHSLDGSPYIDSESGEFKLLEFERRPVWVVEAKELDKNYIYSRRVVFLDRETLVSFMSMNYDQQGRLYRTALNTRSFLPDMGMFLIGVTALTDHIDQHTTVGTALSVPIHGLNRNDIAMGSLLRRSTK
ncbi:MAG: DUF1329 domain-containing protein [Desulfatitalea sp.]|nr:DUF1329 domain-containing protein [Desulfatitalea sp.]NNK00977.1 DUF1329 domain-containing protein [Desulfatitalea sp.]